MIRFLLSQLRFRGGRAMVLVSGVLVAAVSFVLLTSAVTSNELQVRGTVNENFRPAYDILVRPEGSFTELERQRRVVRANYLSGIFGGISNKQYQKIKELPGVEVAAPIANIGYVLPFTEFELPLNDVLNKDPVQIYRVQAKWLANNELSEYQGTTWYVYYTREHRMTYNMYDGLQEFVPGREEPADPCSMYETVGDPRSPFERGGPRLASIDCFSALSPNARLFAGVDPLYGGKGVGTITDVTFPFLLAAVDPEQENRLLKLNKTVVSGRPLKEDDDLSSAPGECMVCGPALPVVVSKKTYVDEFLRFKVQRLRLPKGTNVPEVLDSGRARKFLNDLSGSVIKREAFSPDATYERLLDTLSARGPDNSLGGFFIDKYWTLSPTRYKPAGGGKLRAETVANPISVWRSDSYESGYYPAPPGNEDTQFRQLRSYPVLVKTKGPVQGQLSAGVKPVGRFDPEKLPGFSELSKVPLESYYPPTAELADAKSHEALGDNPLRPTMNLGDYLTQPPFMLTNLRAYKKILDSGIFPDANKEKPISVIRVRVKGVEGVDPVSLEKIRRVAQEIREQTGLAVDITAGSSPTPMTIELPAGKYGRPELTLKEGWVKKGVAVEVLTGVDRKSAALFGLILVVCGFFLANGAFASVRARRKEFGILLSLGWSRSRIFTVVLGELALVGLVAGIAGTVLAAILVGALSLELPLTRTLLVTPVCVLLAVASGLVPALAAAKGEPADVIRPPAKPPRSGRAIRSLAGMAARNLRRLPGRTALGIAGLTVGVSALTVLLWVNFAFYDLLAGTALGEALTTQVRPVDYLSVALAIGLGALSVADVLYLNLRERAAELVTLRTCGWEEKHLTLLGLFEGVGMGLIGGLCGAAAGLVVVGVLGGGLSLQLVGLAALAVAGAAAVALLASLVPLLAISRLTPPTVLAEE